MQSALAIIDIDVLSGQDEITRERLLENLAKCGVEHVVPLWVNWLRERADLRVVCLTRDMDRFDDFLVEVIRKTPGVRGTSAILSFSGYARGDALMDLALEDSLWKRAAATVMIKSQPGMDREVLDALVNLPKHKQVEVVLVLKLFHSTEADLMLLLLGERTSALTGYVMSWVRTVPGVVDSTLISVLDWRVLGSTEDFIELTQRFPERRPDLQTA